ncbi:hypothetical protein ACOACQ_11175 [Nocardioides sp. CPCC 206347]|uniref:hypothetical protein n=1 Tax=unclassified Nocardioides TaxID=2615069 RepID=UPI00360F07B0
MDEAMRKELEERLALIDAGGAAEEPLPPLPLTDLLLAIGGLAVLTVVLLWWAL